MKIRYDFVTNSSSASFIICFARIADKEKAIKTLDEYGKEIYYKLVDANEIRKQMRGQDYIGADWCHALVYPKEAIKKYPNDSFIIIDDYNDAWYDEDYEPVYSDEFVADVLIEHITEENGFSNIEVAYGEGRDG